MLLKLYSFLLLSSFSMQAMQAMNKEILMCPLPLKDLCVDAVARWVDKQLPVIDSYKSLKDAYVILETPMFQQLTMSSNDIHALIAKAYQKLHSSELLLWHKTLEGRTYFVGRVAYSSDRKQMAHACNNIIEIWEQDRDRQRRNCVRILTGHDHFVNSIAYNPNGKQLASCSFDGVIKIWDLESGTCIKTLICHDRDIYSVAYSSNNMQLVSGYTDNVVRIWKSYYENPETIKDVLFSLLSSLYITYDDKMFKSETMSDKIRGLLSSYKFLKSKKFIDLYNSTEFEQTSDIHKQAFASYMKRFAAEYPNSSVTELVKIIQQQNADKLVKQNEERGLQILFHK